ncbi:MAG: stage V sporulation protein AD [Oscillospiraceae bacterium]|nr:stage V sporulation protein AD [Oscillospiraceae bacterium]
MNANRKTDLIKLNKPVYIISSAAVGGGKEKEGPLGEYFDITDRDVKFGTKTFEAGESEMQRVALNTALKKAKTHHKELEAILAGDLLNQCVSSTYGLIEFGAPFIGLFGACSTMAECLALGSLLIDGGHFRKVGAVTSSHFCAAERQFRFPLEYGGQRAPTAQWTVTGSGAVILGGADSSGNSPKITEVMFGRMIDKGITDIQNMGAAMAPAAVDTILKYFRETDANPADFDIIATGDLGIEGKRITENLLLSEGCDIREKYNDCGLMIYDCEKQDAHAGGSGCGCSASVLCGYFMRKFMLGEYKNILLVCTGALMSPGSVMQGNSIPGIAHLVRIEK